MANVTEFAIKVTDNASAALGRIGGSMGGLKTAFAALAVALPVVQLGRMVSASLQAADAAGKAAQKIGISTAEYTGLARAAELAGVSSGSLTMGMKTLSQAMTEGASSTLPAAQQLRALGIASRDAQGNLRPMNQVLLDVADSFAASSNDAGKAAAAVDLFGRAGLEMIPMLNAGRGSIEATIAQAEKLGLVMSDDLAKSSEAVNDNMDILGKVLQGSVNKAMVAIAPVFEEITGKMIQMTTEGNLVEKVATGITVAFRALMSAGTIVSAVFETVGKVLGGVAASIAFLLEGQYTKALETIKNVSVDVGNTVGAALYDIDKQWDESAQAADRAAAREAAAVGKRLSSINRFNADAEKERQVREKSEADAAKRQDDLNKTRFATAMAEDQAYTQGVADLQSFRMSLGDAEANAASQRLIDQTNQLILWRQWNLVSEEEYNAMREEMAINHNARLGDTGAQLQQKLLEIERAGGMGKVALQLQFGQQILAGLATQSRAAFSAQKAMAIAETTMNTYRAAMSSFNALAGIPIVGPVLGAIAAASAVAFGLSQVSKIKSQSFGGAAHGGLDYVPNESTYLLQQGERVLSPRQNRDLTGFMENGQGGGGTIGTVEIHILENATNADAFARMDRAEIRERLGQPVVTALNEMFRIGVRPDFASAAT